MISELFWQCGIFQYDFGTVLTVWYFPIWFRNCSDSVVFFYKILELLWQYFSTWSVQGQESELSCICVLGVSVFASVLGFYRMISELFWQFDIFYMTSELFWEFDIFLHDIGTVLRVWYFSAWFRNCSDSVVFSDMISELFWQCGIFLHDIGIALTVLYFSSCICRRPGMWTVMHLCVRSIDVCLSSRILPHDFWTVLTVWYFFYMISELFWQCGIFQHDFGTVLIVWYFSTWYRSCSDSVVLFDMFSELFWQWDILRHDFWTVLRVWYFSTWFRNCSDSVVFFDMISEMFWQCSISYMISELFWQCSTSYMISELLWQCSISYIISELFWQCGIFLHDCGTLHVCLHDFWTVLTVWYFSTWFQNYSDSVVFFYRISELC
jgi:hypothetical protein